MAIGDGVAPSTPWRDVDPLDGTRRRERAGGARAGQAPGADTDRAQTHGPRGVVGDHPATALGRPDVGNTGLTRCLRSGHPLLLSLLPHTNPDTRIRARGAVPDGVGARDQSWELH